MPARTAGLCRETHASLTSPAPLPSFPHDPRVERRVRAPLAMRARTADVVRTGATMADCCGARRAGGKPPSATAKQVLETAGRARISLPSCLLPSAFPPFRLRFAFGGLLHNRSSAVTLRLRQDGRHSRRRPKAEAPARHGHLQCLHLCHNGESRASTLVPARAPGLTDLAPSPSRRSTTGCSSGKGSISEPAASSKLPLCPGSPSSRCTPQVHLETEA